MMTDDIGRDLELLGHPGLEQVDEWLRVAEHDLAPENDHPTRHICRNPVAMILAAQHIIRQQQAALAEQQTGLERARQAAQDANAEENGLAFLAKAERLVRLVLDLATAPAGGES